MARNPFHYGTPAEGEHFAGRESELAAILSRLRAGINVVVVSPRRYGKTSLLLRAEHELEQDGAAVIHANVLRSRDLASLASGLATQAFRAPGGRWHRARQAVPEFLRRLRARPVVTFEGEHPKFGFDAGLNSPDADDVLADIYGVLAEVAGRRPAALVLDEFQAIVGLGAHLPGLFKALADAHPEVSLVLAGSRRHLMEQLVSAESAALYGMAEPIALGPLPEDVMAAHLRSRAATGGKSMSDAVARRSSRSRGPSPTTFSAWPTRPTTRPMPRSTSSPSTPASRPPPPTTRRATPNATRSCLRDSAASCPPSPRHRPNTRRAPPSSPGPRWPILHRSRKPSTSSKQPSSSPAAERPWWWPTPSSPPGCAAEPRLTLPTGR